MAAFSRRTLELFDQLLGNTTLNVGAPDFDDAAAAVMGARRELAAALAEIQRPNRADRRTKVADGRSPA